MIFVARSIKFSFRTLLTNGNERLARGVTLDDENIVVARHILDVERSVDVQLLLQSAY